MSVKKQKNAFDSYWMYLQKVEQDIRQNGHLGKIPPDSCNDPWDEEFATMYESIHLYLKKHKEERFFNVPVGLSFQNVSIHGSDCSSGFNVLLKQTGRTVW